jgi:hypothetical protein
MSCEMSSPGLPIQVVETALLSSASAISFRRHARPSCLPPPSS